jgi:hypothetical protein
MRRGKILFLQAVVTVILIAGLTGFGQLDKRLGLGHALPLHVLLLGIGIVAGILYSRWKDVEGFRKTLGHSQKALDRSIDPTAEASNLAGRLQRNLGAISILQRLQADYFEAELLPPRGLRARVVEDYEPQGQALHQRVTIDGRLPQDRTGDANTGDIIFPLLVPAKGQLHENLKVYGADGRTPLGVIAYYECLEVIASILRLRIAQACGASPDEPLPQPASMIERSALRAIIQHCNSPAQNRRDSEAAAQSIMDLELIPESSISPETQQEGKVVAASLVRILSTNYVIPVPVRPDKNGRFIVSYEQSLVMSQIPHNSDRWSRIKYKARFYLGTRPVSLKISLRNASKCVSYHLRVNGPEGLYLGKQELLPDALRLPYYRFRRRQGQAHA